MKETNKKDAKMSAEIVPDIQAAEAEWNRIKGELKDNKSRVSQGTKGNNSGGKARKKRMKVSQELQRKKRDDGNNQRNVNNDSKAQRNRRDGGQIIKGGQAFKSGKKGCPHIIKCGGCQMQQKEYEEYLKDKEKLVGGLLSKFCTIDKIIGMDKPYHYRNKVHAVFDHDKKGNPISGIYEEGTHNVIPIDSCLTHNKKADEIIVSIRGMLKSFKIKTYDEDTGYGLIRHVLVRTGIVSGEIMVVIVLSSPIFPSKNNFVKALRLLHPEITTIIVNVNDKDTNMILGERELVIYGKGYIEDSICGKVFRIYAKSFFHINPAQTELIYNKVIELAGLLGKETVIDAYCGIGTIGLIVSDHVKKVIGVDLNKDAVRDAMLNAKRNLVTNIEFFNRDASELMSHMVENKQAVDIVIMNPSRVGSDEIFLGAMAQLKPEKVVYISSNLVTLERDLIFLTKKGYKVEKIVPIDMLPWTEHVETCCLLYKVK